MKKLIKTPKLLIFLMVFCLSMYMAPLNFTSIVTAEVTDDSDEEDDSDYTEEDEEYSEEDEEYSDEDEEYDEYSDEDEDDSDEDEEDSDEEDDSEDEEPTVYLSKTSVSIKKAKTYSLTTKNTTGKTLVYKTSNKTVATVSQAGKITAKKVGTAIITVTTKDKTYKDTCKVTVSGISLKATSLTLKKGKTYSILKLNTTKQKLVYKSSKKSVATISATGKITAKKAGTVTITVKSKDGKYSVKCKLKVKK